MTLAAGRVILGTSTHRLGAHLNALASPGHTCVLHDLASPRPGDDTIIEHVLVGPSLAVALTSLDVPPGRYWSARGRTWRGRTPFDQGLLDDLAGRSAYTAELLRAILTHHGHDLPTEAVSVITSPGPVSIWALDSPCTLDAPALPHWWHDQCAPGSLDDSVVETLATLTLAPIRPTGHIAAGVA